MRQDEFRLCEDDSIANKVKNVIVTHLFLFLFFFESMKA